MPPYANPSAKQQQTTPPITPQKSPLFEVFFYAVPNFSDLLRRTTDIKSGFAANKLKMSPVVALWLTLAFIGVLISANSYFMGAQTWMSADTLTTIIPLGREDVTFRPMALFPPVLLVLSKILNFCLWAVGLLIPDLPFSGGSSPEWTPAVRPTIWSNATLAFAWWVAFIGSVIISSTQGLFTRQVPLSKQREYAKRLNAIARIDLNPKAIAPAKRAVESANNYGRKGVWALTLFALAGWGWELFVADGALAGSTLSATTCWIYGLASTFMAEVCWFIAEHCGKKIDPSKL